MRMLLLASAAALTVTLGGTAFAQEAGSGPQKSITPNSLSGTTSGSSVSGAGDAANPNEGAATTGKSTDDSGAKITGGAGSGAGGTPQGRNNTMDDTGTKSSGPGEGQRQ